MILTYHAAQRFIERILCMPCEKVSEFEHKFVEKMLLDDIGSRITKEPIAYTIQLNDFKGSAKMIGDKVITITL